MTAVSVAARTIARMTDETTLTHPRTPPALRALMDAEYDYADGYGVDFEPYPELEPVAETASWFRSWTGNPDVTGEQLRPFGQDGSGGYVCSWVVREGRELADQPVVFIGSEGEVALLAADAADALWFFAQGWGPLDVPLTYAGGLQLGPAAPLGELDEERAVRPVPELLEAAERLAPGRRRAPARIVADAAAAGLPDLRAWVDGLCR